MFNCQLWPPRRVRGLHSESIGRSRGRTLHSPHRSDSGKTELTPDRFPGSGGIKRALEDVLVRRLGRRLPTRPSAVLWEALWAFCTIAKWPFPAPRSEPL